jgi:hypothetical protein
VEGHTWVPRAGLGRIQHELVSQQPPVIVVAPVVMRHGWLKYVVKDLETNPHTQYKVHLWGVIYWLINFPLIVALFFGAPGLWLKLGIFITLIYSIYANFATDYGAMSAAMAAYSPGGTGLPQIPMEGPQVAAHYAESALIRSLLEKNNELTETVARHTATLDEIHRHVAALTPAAGSFPPPPP